jgi:hypothetical protein
MLSSYVPQRLNTLLSAAAAQVIVSAVTAVQPLPSECECSAAITLYANVTRLC